MYLYTYYLRNKPTWNNNSDDKKKNNKYANIEKDKP